ncbi:type IV pilus biogenesis protein PilM [Alteromonas sp. a30]|uniref:type IV pilus biogenesis protein PilM n=1 Tax=Alteromonas sp. a30 TaxID=2730917 RepID=UPI0022829BB7|nr:type IV pilus assembly protein PilM [Alteromonas sp. a30]
MLKKLLQPKQKPLLGLDIGTRFVKAVLLNHSNGVFEITDAACEPILGEAFAEREVKDFDAISHCIKKVKHRLKLKNKEVSVAVSGTSVLTKKVYMLPNQTDAELEAQIELEADSLIPFPLEDVYIDFEKLGTQTDERDDVLLSVAHKNMIDSRITLLRELEFEPKIIDIEGFALGNALQHFRQSTSGQAIACFNIGATQLQLTVIDENQEMHSKELPFGTDHLIKDICLFHGLDQNTAIQQLKDQTLPETWRNDAYPHFLGNLQQSFNKVMQLYTGSSHKDAPKTLLLSGGGTLIEGLVSDLSTDMNKQFEVFNPFTLLSKNAPHIDRQSGPIYAIAVGLACRSTQSCHT